MNRGHPHYSNDPQRPMLCGDNVSKGERRGTITALSTGDRTRVRVNWADGGGFTDEQPRALLHEAKSPPITSLIELPVDIYDRVMTGTETDADLVTVADALRRGSEVDLLADETVCSHGLLVRECAIDGSPFAAIGRNGQ